MIQVKGHVFKCEKPTYCSTHEHTCKVCGTTLKAGISPDSAQPCAGEPKKK